jgi:ParB-like chromosome segregation protein Spo0J
VQAANCRGKGLPARGVPGWCGRGATAPWASVERDHHLAEVAAAVQVLISLARLLTLPESVRSYIEDGKLTAGHARTLVASDSPADLANKIISLGLSVREAETLTRNNPATSTRKAKATKDADTRALEKQLADAMGLRVEIKAQGREGGTLLIKYKTLDQLDGITHRLMSKK